MSETFVLAWLAILTGICALLCSVAVVLYKKMMTNHYSYMECRQRLNLLSEHGAKVGIKYKLPILKKGSTKIGFDLTKLEPLGDMHDIIP